MNDSYQPGQTTCPNLTLRDIESAFLQNEIGDAKLLSWVYTWSLRFCSRNGRWCSFDGQHWQMAPDAGIPYVAMRSMVQAYRCLADDIDRRLGEDPKNDRLLALRQKVSRRIEALQTERRASAVLKLARSQLGPTDPGSAPKRFVDAEAFGLRHDRGWNANPWILPVANGVVDLRAGFLTPGSPEYFTSPGSPFPFLERAICPRFSRFLQEICSFDEAKVHFLQKIFGYCATARTDEQKFFVFLGDGASGKSSLMRIISGVLGSLAGSIPVETVLRGKGTLAGNAARPDLRLLAEKRLLVATEPDEGRRFDEGLLKSWTGEDELAARGLYAATVENIRPTAKLVVLANTAPRFSGDAYPMRRRITVIPFAAHIRPGAGPGEIERVRGLAEQILCDEGSGVLGWIVEGALRWQAEGLSDEPVCVIDAGRAYQDENDAFAEFFDEEIEIFPPGIERKADVFTRFQSFFERSGFGGACPSRNRLVKWLLGQPGISEDRTRRGRILVGLRLNP